MAKLTTHGNELLPPNRYVLEVVEAEAVNEYGPQLRLKDRVAEGRQHRVRGRCPAWPGAVYAVVSLT
jgi:hypothetical protein